MFSFPTISTDQKHLDIKTTVNLGSYYTPSNLVNIVYKMLVQSVFDFEKYTILDSSCGYGSFLQENFINRFIGVDIDKQAIAEAKNQRENIEFFCKNSLENLSRKALSIKSDERLIIVGNPPYNDRTSIIRNHMKKISTPIDSDLKTRDLGMSFLLSYEKLQADYVCVLHPLSYLIKKSNFSLLSKFAKNYKLIDGVIFNSQEFSGTSKVSAFPILIGLYQRDHIGMNCEFIECFEFKIKDGGTFRLNDFDTIKNYIHKYPNKKYLKETDEPIAKFYTLRDINALKRNRTFIDYHSNNAVYVCKDKFPYYCYIDIFKRYIHKLPYFLGNCDVIIDNEKFQKIQEYFVEESIRTHPVLKNHFKPRGIPNAKIKIESYFEELFAKIYSS
ncbi:hypothetical protein BKH42_03020 [Helicobacter sp. 13S00482-2]|uniref:SAM-dependent methyltransferase n=1 Tax=Helicobacter sp. 13S00482-2 TaxID=1476200 RepID=UPI000BA68AD7|nr:SAM-dependent methyltransferase [Helicobacter sp. 13S00482-2]PAF53955.1 hypothetical protein BKH42_03020 [Helicobacter sp. 13S00482-2]